MLDSLLEQILYHPAWENVSHVDGLYFFLVSFAISLREFPLLFHIAIT